MAKAGSIVVASTALALGALLGAAGLYLMLDAGSFFSAEQRESNGILGVFGGGEQRASMGTAPWVGLVAAMVGVSLLLFGFRGLYVTFEGREA